MTISDFSIEHANGLNGEKFFGYFFYMWKLTINCIILLCKQLSFYKD